MKLIGGKVSSASTRSWVFFNYRSEILHELLTAEKARVMVDGRSKLVPVASVLEVPFVFSASTWADAQRVAAA